MNSLREHLGVWIFKHKGVLKQWELRPVDPAIEDVKDDREYSIGWDTLSVASPPKRRLNVNAVEALARALDHMKGGYQLSKPYNNGYIPPSASLTTEQMREIRNRLAKARQRADGFTWSAWAAGEEFPNN